MQNHAELRLRQGVFGSIYSGGYNLYPGRLHPYKSLITVMQYDEKLHG